MSAIVLPMRPKTECGSARSGKPEMAVDLATLSERLNELRWRDIKRPLSLEEEEEFIRLRTAYALYTFYAR
ncbi:MAG TPA: hypothetical protein VNG29_02285 [Candidatus Paceibacterota bacterium]|nr:hypothetical protein [Candidatus Paceibacterota bacterium]